MTIESVTPSVPETRHAGLQQELQELLGVVGPAQLADILVERAFHLHATDIHLDPVPEGLRIRLRVDGDLHDVITVPGATSSAIVSRLKVLAGLDITERRRPQDGRLSNLGGNGRDVRVATGPTIHGERIVMRLMADSRQLDSLADLGLFPDQLRALRNNLRQPYGLILVVGPVGSGKTTTVYSSVNELNDPRKSIVTIEDPVERRIDGLAQIEVDPRADFNFVDALRGVLRQDPNIMVVGEIRDAETAQIAARSALTGVLVLSTLHASDTASAVEVLRALDVPPLMIADSLKCVVTQRLVRKICSERNEPFAPDRVTMDMLGIDESVKLTRGIPDDCNFQTGYAGRTAVYEIMELNSDLRSAILNGDSAETLRRIAIDSGMITIQEATRRKVLAGETSVEELHRLVHLLDNSPR